MDEHDTGARLRAHGLRVTPQRRAILSAFGDERAEHLSADEVHARAAATIPEIGRGTVYSALAELTELGLLAAVGAPEPVRYEANTSAHHHFRCRLCVRLFDVALDEPPTDHLHTEGFQVERLTITAEGICAECTDYDAALVAAAERARERPGATPVPEAIAVTTVETPLGEVTLAATAAGLVRAVFDNHGDVPVLHARMRARRGPRAAHGHLAQGRASVETYFAHGQAGPCAIDWDALEDAETLRATTHIGPARSASYDTLRTSADAADRGRALGANPLALFVPCHRVTRGRQIPSAYVGGEERRLALRELER